MYNCEKCLSKHETRFFSFQNKNTKDLKHEGEVGMVEKEELPKVTSMAISFEDFKELYRIFNGLLIYMDPFYAKKEIQA